MNQPPILRVEQVTKSYTPQGLPAVSHLSLQLAQGELLGLLGPSGCGKTTLLRMIAGFEQPTAGAIYLQDQLVSDRHRLVPPESRHTGMVFQDYALFPHLSIGDNVAFGLKNQKEKWSRRAIHQRVKEILGLVGLGGLEKRFPHELSGGQQQRVALARAIAPQPSLILLDEPLSNLDVQVRQRLRYEIRRILKATHTAGIFVTHDQEEALAISDRIGVMSHGHLDQLGTPEEIYGRPASRFVAEFVTHANFLPAQKQGNQWQTEIGPFAVEEVAGETDQGELMLREEEIHLEPNEESDVVIQARQFLGREYRYCLQTHSGRRLHARTHASVQLEVGAKVQLDLGRSKPQIFPILA